MHELKKCPTVLAWIVSFFSYPQLPSELKDKLTIELDLKQEQESIGHHPAWSKKLWRTKSTGSYGNAKTDAQRKTFHSYTLNE